MVSFSTQTTLLESPPVHRAAELEAAIEVVTVLRVELLDERRTGPYACTLTKDHRALGNLLDDIHRESPAHPAWFLDTWQRFDQQPHGFRGETSFKLKRSLDFFLGLENPIAGFLDHDQLKNWFDPDARSLLDEFGYALASYEVLSSQLFVSSSQVIFDRSNSKLLRVDEL